LHNMAKNIRFRLFSYFPVVHEICRPGLPRAGLAAVVPIKLFVAFRCDSINSIPVTTRLAILLLSPCVPNLMDKIQSVKLHCAWCSISCHLSSKYTVICWTFPLYLFEPDIKIKTCYININWSIISGFESSGIYYRRFPYVIHSYSFVYMSGKTY